MKLFFILVEIFVKKKILLLDLAQFGFRGPKFFFRFLKILLKLLKFGLSSAMLVNNELVAVENRVKFTNDSTELIINMQLVRQRRLVSTLGEIEADLLLVDLFVQYEDHLLNLLNFRLKFLNGDGLARRVLTLRVQTKVRQLLVVVGRLLRVRF